MNVISEVDPQAQAEDFRRGKKATSRQATVNPDEYGEYLRSDAWASTKARYRRSRLPQKCVVCDESKVDLHHRSYKRLGNEYLTDLIPLCRAHHLGLHRFHEARPNKPLWANTKAYVKSFGRTLRGRKSRRRRNGR